MRLDSKEVGLTSFAMDDRPPVAIPFFAFRVMVGRGLLMMALDGSPLKSAVSLGGGDGRDPRVTDARSGHGEGGLSANCNRLGRIGIDRHRCSVHPMWRPSS